MGTAEPPRAARPSRLVRMVLAMPLHHAALLAFFFACFVAWLGAMALALDKMRRK
jgi:hypothetical protein